VPDEVPHNPDSVQRRDEDVAPLAFTRDAQSDEAPLTGLERRHSRLLRVASLLDGDCHTEPDWIAREIGISRRTLYRDLAVLRQAGVRMSYSREERRYKLDSLHARITLALSAAEAAAFLDWAGKRRDPGRQAITPLDRAISKIARILSADVNPATDHTSASH